jgi:CubicO group peptidase (beta-lactamase class C family)
LQTRDLEKYNNSDSESPKGTFNMKNWHFPCRTFCFSILIIWLFSSTAFASFESEVEELLNNAFDPNEPGVAVVVTKGGKVLYSGAIGTANLELGTSLSPTMPFEVASITKQITSAAILILEEQGKLHTNDKLSVYFPDHPSGSATIEQLMQNISGAFVPDHSMGSNRVRADLTSEERLELLHGGQPYFAPGERYAYSNAGYWLLGDIIEKVSGVSYADFIQENIFSPVGMSNSYYGSHRNLIPNRVAGYDYTENGLKNASYTSETWAYSAGGLISSAVDIALWSNALFKGEVVPQESVGRMVTKAELNSGEKIPYGFGLALAELDGYRTAEHGGGHSGFLVHTTRLIDEDIFVVVLANSFYMTNGYRPPEEKNPAIVARRLALMAVETSEP